MPKTTKTLGPVTAIIGAQWGDEGKGKIIDRLSEQFTITARAAGGANAGHTVIAQGKKYAFHLLPCASLHRKTRLVLGAGMVIHLPTLLEEIAMLEEDGIDVLSRLFISEAAHIVFDFHMKVDGVIEERRLGEKNTKGIGTTRRGIGPTYADKAYRTGMRMGDLRDLSPDAFKRKFQHNASYVHKMFGIRVSAQKELKDVVQAKKLLKKCIRDTSTYLHAELSKGKSLLIEGAQASLLDIDHGTYPYVTSSATTIMGALQGLGIPPQMLTSVIGVAKAYCTRVGGGPFPTEVQGKRGDDLRGRGGEYGATTGRPRRCGWLDLADLRRATKLNGFTHLNLTKLDVLDAETDIPLFDGKKKKLLPGWQKSTAGITSFSDLPPKAKNYITYIEKEIGVPVTFIGTGPGREEMIVR